MKFVASSSELLGHLAAINRVINTKNTLPILDNFLFQLEGNELTMTASDLETTLSSRLSLENASEEGTIAIPARILTEILKEFPEQPLTFEIDMETLKIVIQSENGQFSIVGQNGNDFPQLPVLKEEAKASLRLDAEVLLSGISKTIFATAEDELRPVMNGIYIELTPDDITFVASDAHKLVKYQRTDVSGDVASSFIIPKKPASLLKNILPKSESDVMLEFDDKNAIISFKTFVMICRLVEGKYPSYNSVIPTENPNKVTIDRLDLYNSLRRVSVFSNQASNLIKLKMTGNQVMVSAQDIDFSISAYERLNCQYDGDEMEIGFKSTFLIEILSNLASADVVLEMSDPSRAGIMLPAQKENDHEDVLMLLMPMMVGN
jgi:DNA polymerase III subunit beta